MGLQIRDGYLSRRIDQYELVFKWPRLAEVNRSHAHREVDVFVGGDALRSRKKRRLVFGKNQQTLLGPHHEASAGACFAAAAVEEPVVKLRQLLVHRRALRRRNAPFGDSRYLTRNEQVGWSIECGNAERWPVP